MTRVCEICVSHPFLLDWVEKLIIKGYNLREVTRRLNAHGLHISYRAVQKHKRHMSSARAGALLRQVEGKQKHPSMLQRLNSLKRQREELASWTKAESKPPQEALNAYVALDGRIRQLEMALGLRKPSVKVTIKE